MYWEMVVAKAMLMTLVNVGLVVIVVANALAITLETVVLKEVMIVLMVEAKLYKTHHR
jgi:hypothetical protein